MHKIFRLRRITRSLERDIERLEVRQTIRSSDEIPFGARAMLEDPDVEGVWNSKASTPLQSPVLPSRNSSPSRFSLNMFSRSRRNSSVSSIGSISSNDNALCISNGRQSLQISSTQPDATTSSAVNRRDSAPDTMQTEGTRRATIDYTPIPRRRSVTIRAAPKQEPLTANPTQGL